MVPLRDQQSSDTGHASDAGALVPALLSDVTRVLGPDHPMAASITSALTGHRTQADELAELYHDLSADFARSDAGTDTLTDEQRLEVREEVEQFISDRREKVSAVDEWLIEVATKTRELGDDHEHVLAARRELADSRIRAGDLTTGFAELRVLVTDYARVYGATHPYTFSRRLWLALRHGSVGDFSNRLAELESLAADQRDALGPSHPDTLRTRSHLAAARNWMTELEEVLAAQVAQKPDSSDVFQTRHYIDFRRL